MAKIVTRKAHGENLQGNSDAFMHKRVLLEKTNKVLGQISESFASINWIATKCR